MQLATAPKTRTAIVGTLTGDTSAPERVTIARSKAAAAGPNGVRFYAPGWRPMVCSSMDAAVRKLERHPGFMAWEA